MNTKVRLIILLVGLAILIGPILSGVTTQKVEAQGPNPGNYRVPVIGPYRIERMDPHAGANCENHFGRGRYMDINGWPWYNRSGNTDWGDPIYASGSGTIIDTGYEAGGYGNYVVLESGSVTFRYAHLAGIRVSEGQSVSQGDLIGLLGNTGDSRGGTHLHWEAWLTAEGPGSTTFNTFDITGVDEDNSPCVGDDDGNIFGNNVGGSWMNCPEFENSGHIRAVYLFDHDDCKGNLFYANVNDDGSPREYNLAWDYDWNDRVQSMSIPNGMSVLMSAHVPGTGFEELTHCHNETMYFMSSGEDTYDQNPSVNIGFDSNRPDGFDMISWIRVYNNSDCSGGGEPQVGSETIGGSGGHGDSRVDIRVDEGCEGAQYGWDEPTNGIVNVEDFMNDDISCVDIDPPGMSIMLYEHADGLGASKCLNHTVEDLSFATLVEGTRTVNANNRVSSVRVFGDSICGGQMPLGVAPGDTVTIHVHLGQDDPQWGVHDPGTWDIDTNWLANEITWVGITPGWSMVGYQDQNLGGGAICFTASDSDLTDNLFDNDQAVNDDIESIRVFQDSICGGWTPTEPTATVIEVPTNTPLPPTNIPLEPSTTPVPEVQGENHGTGLDVWDYCVHGLNAQDAGRVGEYARDWVCIWSDGRHAYVDMNALCRWQDEGSHPHAGLSDASNWWSWSCNTHPQPPWPDGPQSQLPVQDLEEVPAVVPQPVEDAPTTVSEPIQEPTREPTQVPVPTDTLEPTEEPVQPSRNPLAILDSFEREEDCKWVIWVELSGFDPNSSITIVSHGTRYPNCDPDSAESYRWSGTNDRTDENGAAWLGYFHFDYGRYNFSFTDEAGNSAGLTVEYSYE